MLATFFAFYEAWDHQKTSRTRIRIEQNLWLVLISSGVTLVVSSLIAVAICSCSDIGDQGFQVNFDQPEEQPNQKKLIHLDPQNEPLNFSENTKL